MKAKHSFCVSIHFIRCVNSDNENTRKCHQVMNAAASKTSFNFTYSKANCLSGIVTDSAEQHYA